MPDTAKCRALAIAFANSGKTREDLSKVSGVDRNTVSRAVRGDCIRRDLLVRIVEALYQNFGEQSNIKVSLTDIESC